LTGAAHRYIGRNNILNKNQGAAHRNSVFETLGALADNHFMGGIVNRSDAPSG